MIDGYTNFEEIGRGGFSHVYRATQTAFGRVVAIKVLDGIDPSDEKRSMFARECRAVGTLHWHPNIVTVFDAGITDRGQSFIAMEYAPQGSLGARVSQGAKLAENATRAIGAKIASALQAAHDAGILHRDVKPANILVNEIGEPVLADFGIASVSEGTQTTTGNISATLAHAAPEVLNGERATAASDVYALASTLFTLFVGRGPYSSLSDDSAVGLITRALTAPIPDLAEFGATPSFANAIARGLSRNPSERFTTAREFAEALSSSVVNTAPTVRTEAPTVPLIGHDDSDLTVVRTPSTDAAGQSFTSGTIMRASIEPDRVEKSATARSVANDARPGGGAEGEKGPKRPAGRGPRRLVASVAGVVVFLGILYTFARHDGDRHWFVGVRDGHVALYQGSRNAVLGWEPQLRLEDTSALVANITDRSIRDRILTNRLCEGTNKSEAESCYRKAVNDTKTAPVSTAMTTTSSPAGATTTATTATTAAPGVTTTAPVATTSS